MERIAQNSQNISEWNEGEKAKRIDIWANGREIVCQNYRMKEKWSIDRK